MSIRSLHNLEVVARRDGTVEHCVFTSSDVVSVKAIADSDEFEYRHNGVVVDRARVEQLIPWF